MKIINNKKSASATLGVILMVLITVAIAGTVYFYVTEISIKEKSNISGNITDKFIIGCQYPHYYFVINNSFDITVNETCYYKYNIGDLYIIGD